MKKTTITVSFDEEKLTTLRLYLTEKELQVEDVLIKALDSLYVKAVPQPVQHYLELRGGTAVSPAPQKPKAAPKVPAGVTLQTKTMQQRVLPVMTPRSASAPTIT